jgi:hypothetical protein
MTGYDRSIASSLVIMKPFQDEFVSEVDGIKATFISSIIQIGGAGSMPFIATLLIDCS